MKKPLLLYVVYGPDEKQDFELLDAHLAVPKRNGEIEVWERSKIAPGRETDQEISSKLEQVDIALFLVTADAIDSEASYQEMMLTLSILQPRHKPIYRLIMRPVSWQRSFLDHTSPLHQDHLPPVMAQSNPDKALTEVATKLRTLANNIALGKALFDTTSQTVSLTTPADEIDPKPLVLGFGLDMSSSAINNLRSQAIGKNKGSNAIKLLIEAARSIHTALENDPYLLHRLQTTLFLYAFGLKQRSVIDVYTCMNIAQRLITPEIIGTYQKHPQSPIAEVLSSLAQSLPIDHRRSLRKIGANLVENWIAQKIVEDYAEQIMTTAEQSYPISPTLADFWEQLEENAGMRLYHAAYLVGGKKPSLATVLSPIIQRFRQELHKAEKKPAALFFFLSDGEFSSYQFSPFKQQLEELGVVIISCYLSKHDYTHNYRILHGTSEDYWSEEAQALWQFASVVDIPEQELLALTKRGWHIEKNARFFLQINHSAMLTDLLAVLLQERQRSL